MILAEIIQAPTECPLVSTGATFLRAFGDWWFCRWLSGRSGRRSGRGSGWWSGWWRDVTLVVFSNLSEIDGTETVSLSQLFIRVRERSDDGNVAVDGEGIPSIMHNRLFVVRFVQRTSFSGGVFCELTMISCRHIAEVDSDEAITVSPGLFVVESDSVHQFMYDDSDRLTSTSDRDCLCSTVDHTKVRVTTLSPDESNVESFIRPWFESYACLSLEHIDCLPHLCLVRES